MANTQMLSMLVSLPKGVKGVNFEDSVGLFTQAKKADKITPIFTKTGKRVGRCAMNYTKLKKIIAKYPAIVKRDVRSGDEIVWITGFEK